MKGFSCSDINTGWKPVTHEDESNALMQETLVSGRDDMDEKDGAQRGGVMDDTHVQQILHLLQEIQREMTSLKQLMISMGSPDAAPKGMKKRKLRKSRFL